MKLNYRLIAKIGLLLVLIGFFMPVACKQTAFEVAQNAVKHDNSMLKGLLLYLMALSAAAGVLVGVLLLLKIGKVKVNVDWIIIIVCIASGLIALFIQLDQLGRFKKHLEPQAGAFMILIGWIIAVCGQFMSKAKREK
jgi:nitrate reductase gamma subunit